MGKRTMASTTRRQLFGAGLALPALVAGTARALLHDDAVDVGVGDVFGRAAPHQAGVLGNHLEAVARRQVDRALGTMLLGMFASDAVIGALFAAIERVPEMREATKIVALIRACAVS